MPVGFVYEFNPETGKSYLVTVPGDSTKLLTTEEGTDCCCPPEPECWIPLVPCGCCKDCDSNRFMACSQFLADYPGQASVVIKIGEGCYTITLADQTDTLPLGAIISGGPGAEDDCESCCNPECWYKCTKCVVAGCPGGTVNNDCGPGGGVEYFVPCELVPPALCDFVFEGSGGCFQVNCLTVYSQLPPGAQVVSPGMWWPSCGPCCCCNHCNDEHQQLCDDDCPSTITASVSGLQFIPHDNMACFAQGTPFCVLWAAPSGITLTLSKVGPCHWFGTTPGFATPPLCAPQLSVNISCTTAGGVPGWKAEVSMLFYTKDDPSAGEGCELVVPACNTCCNRQSTWFSSSNLCGCPVGPWQNLTLAPPDGPEFPCGGDYSFNAG
jgi:hypothetical protein